jgi:hypothetical protein
LTAKVGAKRHGCRRDGPVLATAAEIFRVPIIALTRETGEPNWIANWLMAVVHSMLRLRVSKQPGNTGNALMNEKIQ